ncbi:hypothetical protein FT663_02162 [Candidozyma haemuli var. vulneris]|uniref:Golgi apyrase n=1 Tax=Candidozyma haemuli TaxID=45357 RepID=A0A2V1ALR0_9ASCO|nr:hypothetical protein CXQ85_001119 [[Candida] haemuloni]KAF3990320.1 hypothetical protein FT662_02313 [[Candida] haemuloni var. vulneris]KAF3992789.1 hypothetical protein FT663_02162 [[Candida] haemuloni var. vulneris]PVH18829.1 hypothetical protein CXQ85_001119 [[Candida] haemuloni]
MGGYKYGVVVDSGSSGSRVQIYRWEDPGHAKESASEDRLRSPPKISQEQGWSSKITPGASTFGEKPGKIWKQHYKKLMKFAEDVIPKDKWHDTPVYVLATAGMRLLPEQQQEKIVSETCKALQKHTDFKIGSCSDHVQVIDGATEGIYGWLALNYLMGKFDNFDSSAVEHESIGFMDMGGASTQVAFVPSPEEIEKHDEDLFKVLLRNQNGELQNWRVFTGTWLGFGANRARKRYLDNLISLLLSTNVKYTGKKVNDPCMPKGAEIKDYTYGNKQYLIKGTGNYEVCLKEIYPLLMKNMPCTDEPCLFNGMHAPKMNFEKDKFVGVSEYWYTANDIFHSGGEYNFHSFNDKVRDYCESSWETVLANSKNGEYSNLGESFLLDACFKASWVINILHEGFGLPRLGIEVDPQDDKETSDMKDVQQAHVPFKSADSIEGDELSWTLGKALLVASSQVDHEKGAEQVGITGSALSLKAGYDSDGEGIHSYAVFYLFFIIVILVFGFLGNKLGYSKVLRKVVPSRIPGPLTRILSAARNRSPPEVKRYLSSAINYIKLQEQEDINMDLEGGTHFVSSSPTLGDGSSLRTRSTINLGDMDDTPHQVDFFNKPFVNPKKGPIYNHRNESRDSLHRVSSLGSMKGRQG